MIHARETSRKILETKTVSSLNVGLNGRAREQFLLGRLSAGQLQDIFRRRGLLIAVENHSNTQPCLRDSANCRPQRVSATSGVDTDGCQQIRIYASQQFG